MRFDKTIELLLIDTTEDGLGGRTEAQNTIYTFNANVEELGLETTMKIYGVGISGNIQAVILGSITLDKNKEYRVKYNNDLYTSGCESDIVNIENCGLDGAKLFQKEYKPNPDGKYHLLQRKSEDRFLPFPNKKGYRRM